MTDQTEQFARKFNSDIPDLSVTDTENQLREKVFAHISFATKQLLVHAEREPEAVKNHERYSPHVSVRLGVTLEGLDHDQLKQSHGVLFKALQLAFGAAEEAGTRVLDVEGYGVTNSHKTGTILSVRVTVVPEDSYDRACNVLANGLETHIAHQTLRTLFGGDDDDDLPEGFSVPIH